MKKSTKTLQEILDHIRVQVIDKPFDKFTAADVSQTKNIVSYIQLGRYATVPNFGSCACKKTYRRIYDYLTDFYHQKTTEQTHD